MRRTGSVVCALLLWSCSGAEGAADPAREDVRRVVGGDESTRAAMDDSQSEAERSPADPTAPAAVVTFGAGCFWCVEAVLEQVDGVLDVQSGYMGGDVPDPSYEQVCTGTTGHAEVAQ